MKKIIAVIFAVVIAISASVYGFAASGEINYENAVVLEPIIHVNPLYKDVISPEDLDFEFNKNSIPEYFSVNSYTDSYDVAGAQMREYLESRTKNFSINFKTIYGS